MLKIFNIFKIFNMLKVLNMLIEKESGPIISE